ncbi:hypothetical protein ACFQU2_30435 [Siccirubricoccus deserti]
MASTIPAPADRLPRPYDPEAASRLAERFAERDAAARAWAASPAGRRCSPASAATAPTWPTLRSARRPP